MNENVDQNLGAVNTLCGMTNITEEHKSSWVTYFFHWFYPLALPSLPSISESWFLFLHICLSTSPLSHIVVAHRAFGTFSISKTKIWYTYISLFYGLANPSSDLPQSRRLGLDIAWVWLPGRCFALWLSPASEVFRTRSAGKGYSACRECICKDKGVEIKSTYCEDIITFLTNRRKESFPVDIPF